MLISKKNILLFISLITSLFLGFYLNEDSLGGAIFDYRGLEYLQYEFKNDFVKSFYEYDKFGHRQSPVLYIVKSVFIPIEDVYVRFFFLCIFILCPYYFYKCLTVRFPTVDKNYIFPFSIIIILFPTFRSYSIWPDPHMVGFLFFLISMFYFLKFEMLKNKKFKNSLISCVFLSISSYFSPNYGVLIIYFFFKFYEKKLNFNLFLIIIILNLFLSLPFFYYLFILDINFIVNKIGWDIGQNIFSITNYSNKILIFFSIFLFYFLPFSLFLKFKWSIFINNKLITFIALMTFIFLSLNFNFRETYNLTNSGGGFFYNLSNYLFNNNLVFFIVSFFGFLSILYLILVSKWNLIIFITLIFSNPQNTIWQANFSPILFVLIFLAFNLSIKKEIFKTKPIFIMYLYFFGYLALSLFKKYYLV